MKSEAERIFEAKHNVRLVAKEDSKLMLLGALLFGKQVLHRWVTYRFPFGKTVITYPLGITAPMHYAHRKYREHELGHVKQFEKWWGPLWIALLYFLLPLPMYFSGRWFVERKIYLEEIKKGDRTPTEVVDLLWDQYFKPWPKKRMMLWFMGQLEPRETVIQFKRPS